MRHFVTLFVLLLAVIARGGETRPFLEAVEGEGSLRLRWQTTAGREYDLQESQDLSTWSSVPGFPAVAAGRVLQYTFPPETDRQFFRVFDLGIPVQPRRIEAFFSVAGPTGDEEDLTLEEKIQELLLLAEPDSEVRGALYTWSRTNMADAFIAAHQRGVDVRLIVGSDYQAVRRLENAMPGRILVCRDKDGIPSGCHGGNINHNKFFLFSRLSDGSRDVVVQSSANFTNPQIRSNNNLVIVRNDTAFFNAYHIYWQDLQRQTTNLNYFWETGAGSDPRVWFFPRQEASGTTGVKDPIAEILDQVVVSPTAEIHLAMAFFTDARRGIAERLVSLRAAGVKVSAIVDPENTGGVILATLEAGGVTVIRYRPVHSKYLLIDHRFGRNQERLVFTGSHNYTSPALRSNDETLLRLKDEQIYEAFLQDWRSMSLHPLAQ